MMQYFDSKKRLKTSDKPLALFGAAPRAELAAAHYESSAFHHKCAASLASDCLCG